jgi:septum formation protein
VSVLVLASASAARARLLADAGIDAERDPADIDEAAIKRECRRDRQSAADCAARLAEIKARTVAVRHPDRLVLGADQLLDCDGDWFDKPGSLSDARNQLRALRGRTHELATAAAVIRNGDILWRALAKPRLTMRHFSDAFLDRYLATIGDRALKTVGGYELEGPGAQLMAKIEGDYFAILGLPLLPLLDFLRETGAVPS